MLPVRAHRGGGRQWRPQQAGPACLERARRRRRRRRCGGLAAAGGWAWHPPPAYPCHAALHRFTTTKPSLRPPQLPRHPALQGDARAARAKGGRGDCQEAGRQRGGVVGRRRLAAPDEAGGLGWVGAWVGVCARVASGLCCWLAGWGVAWMAAGPARNEPNHTPLDPLPPPLPSSAGPEAGGHSVCGALRHHQAWAVARCRLRCAPQGPASAGVLAAPCPACALPCLPACPVRLHLHLPAFLPTSPRHALAPSPPQPPPVRRLRHR